MHILVLNVGSSSLRFQLIATDAEAIAGASDRRLARGHIDRIGGEAILTLEAGGRRTKTATQIRDHTHAVEHVLSWLTSDDSGAPITSVGEIRSEEHTS